MKASARRASSARLVVADADAVAAAKAVASGFEDFLAAEAARAVTGRESAPGRCRASARAVGGVFDFLLRATLESRFYRLCGAEPPTYEAVQAIAHNQVCDRMNQPASRVVVPVYYRLLRHLIRFSGTRFDS